MMTKRIALLTIALLMASLQVFAQDSAALEAPRWRVVEGRMVSVERGFDEAVYDGLRQRGHDVQGAPQTVERAATRDIDVEGGQRSFELDASPSDVFRPVTDELDRRVGGHHRGGFRRGNPPDRHATGRYQ